MFAVELLGLTEDESPEPPEFDDLFLLWECLSSVANGGACSVVGEW